ANAATSCGVSRAIPTVWIPRKRANESMERTRMRAPALACATALLTGCFTYIPTQLGSVPQGAQIRVHLNPATQVTLSTQTNRRIEDILEGTLTGRQPDRLLLKVPIAAQQEGFFQSAIDQNVEVPEP